ncbi:MAG: hypothetical protein ACUVX8_10160 [Candidatus Zipacnadales bacterium]
MTLSQELHYRASVHAARLLCQRDMPREALLEEIAPLTETRMVSARRRAAAAVLSRLGLGRQHQLVASGLHRLLAELDEDAGRQLLTYVVACREPLLAGVARGVLYPYFVERRVPEGLSVEEFSAANANGLFEIAGALTHAAVAAYAQRQWGITDSSVTGRALRVLRKGGLLAAAWMSRSTGRCLGYFPRLTLPDIACFAYSLYSAPSDTGYLRLDRLRAGLMVRLFMLRPIAVDFLLDESRRLGLIEDDRSEIAKLPFRSLEAALDAILEAHRVGR